MSWARIKEGGLNTAAGTRQVDEQAVVSQLTTRAAAKKKKNYKLADAIAAELQSVGICYLDDKHQWYTKALVGGVDRKRKREETKIAKKVRCSYQSCAIVMCPFSFSYPPYKLR
jgi:hypothetical protein